MFTRIKSNLRIVTMMNNMSNITLKENNDGTWTVDIAEIGIIGDKFESSELALFTALSRINVHVSFETKKSKIDVC